MKNLRKVLSVVLTVAMLMSVCTCLLATVTTASAEETNYETFVYDFKNADGTRSDIYDNAGHYIVSSGPGGGGGSPGRSHVTEEGLVFYSSHNMFSHQGSYQWTHRAHIMDPDVEDGALFTIKADSTYYITAKYKFGTTTNAQIGLSIGLAQNTDGTTGCGVGTKGNTYIHSYEPTTYKGWMYTSAVIDSDVAFVQASDTTNVGKAVCLIPLGATNDEFIIESVTVTVVDKTKTAATQGDSVTADFEGGMNDLWLPNTGVQDPWYNGEVFVTNDPLDSGRGAVLALHSSGWQVFRFALPAVEGRGGVNIGDINDGYKVQSGHKYRITFDAYLGKVGTDSIDYAGFNGFYHYISPKASIGTRNAGVNLQGFSPVGGESVLNLLRTVKATNVAQQWTTITIEYTYDSRVDDNPYIVFAPSVLKGTEMYMDNITVTDITNESAATGTIILDTQRGTMDADSTYTAAVGSVYKMPVPTREGYVFAGWTKSWHLAVGMTNKTNTVVDPTTANTGIGADLEQKAVTLNADNATRTITTVTAGETRYYAVWVEASKTYDFNNLTSYFDATFGQTNITSAACGRFNGEDIDGDGDMDAVGFLNSGISESDYTSFVLGEVKNFGPVTYYDFYKLRDGVTYRITFNMKVKSGGLNNDGWAVVGLSRGSYAFDNTKVTGYNGLGTDKPIYVDKNGTVYNNGKVVGSTVVGGSEYFEVSTELTAFGLWNTAYNNGSSYKDLLKVNVTIGDVFFDSVTVEAIGYTDNTVVVNGGNADVTVDYANKTVTVVPADGYTVASNGVTLFNNHYFGAEYASVYNVYNDAACTNVQAYTFSYTGGAADPAAMRVIVDLIEDSSKRSIRAEADLGYYRSAGLRFRFTLTDAQIEGATEIGFAVTPAPLATTGNWYENIDGTNVIKGVVYDANTDIVYEVGNGTKSYQVIIAALTQEGVAKNLKAIDFNVVMYVTTAEGTVYYNVGTSSYDDVKAVYAANGTTADAAGNLF